MRAGMSKDFAEEARREAMVIALELVESGESLTDGAVLAIDPRGDAGAEYAVLILGGRGVSEEDARSGIADAIAAAEQTANLAVVTSWETGATLRALMTRIGERRVNPRDLENWLSTPAPHGSVRLAIIHGNSLLDFDVVRYRGADLN